MIEKYKIKSFIKKGKYFFVKREKDETKHRFHPNIVLEFCIFEGSEFTNSLWDEILEKNSYQFAWDSTMRMLSLRGSL